MLGQGSYDRVKVHIRACDSTPYGETQMASITETARSFFEACEQGKGWAECSTYCHPDASFACQADPLAEVRTLKDYADWMKGMFTPMPDARYTVSAFATDPERQAVVASATFHATHTGKGGPVPPTGRKTDSDYVYVMRFEDGKIRQMTKVWNSGWALRELGWGS
jgi:steroid delta-isomerase-like uncharacterized protein